MHGTQQLDNKIHQIPTAEDNKYWTWNIKIKQPATPSQTEITTPKKSKMWTNEMRDPNDLASSKLPCLHHSNSKQTETDPIIAHMQNIQSTNRNFQRLQHKSNDIQAISFVSTSYQNDDALWWKIPEGAPEGRQAGAPGGTDFLALRLTFGHV